MNKTGYHPLFRSLLVACCATLAAQSTALADVIETVGGSTLRGKIIASDGGVIRIETDFGVTIEVPQDKVKTMTTDGPVFVALDDGNQMQGTIQTRDDGLTIAGKSGTLQTNTEEISSVWRQGDMTPADKAEEAARRKWTTSLSFDLNGRQGNRDRFFLGVSGRATLQGEDDRLSFAGSYARGEENGVATQDDAKVGVDYSNFFGENFSWYARTELGFDRSKDLDLRSQSAAGIGYTFVDDERWQLEGRSGISYRFENYSTGEDFDSVGLDFGLINTYDFGWGKMLNLVTFTPSFDDLANYVITHESTLSIPFGGGEWWAMRFGVKNDFTSEPPPGLVKHDWSYFSGITLSWK
jgi:hypothetical protein